MKLFDQIRGDIGERFKSERDRLGLTQSQIADAIGVTRFAVARYESGGSSPLVEQLQVLDQLGADVLFISTGRRCVSTEFSRREFSEICVALADLAAARGITVSMSDVLRSAWMFIDSGRTSTPHEQEDRRKLGDELAAHISSLKP